MKNNNSFKAVIILCTVFCLFGAIVLFISKGESSPNEYKIEIQTDPNEYTPLLSSTIGIGLVPIYSKKEFPEKIKFHWKTNYGEFLSWDNGVKKLGSDVINGGEKIFWSYDSKYMEVKKPIIILTLAVIDMQKNITLAETNVRMRWISLDRAKVVK